jgi:uncharacterized protein HemY
MPSAEPADVSPQLEQAERWLESHSDDATTALLRSACCASARSFGERRSRTLEASLAHDDAWRTRVALGELFVRSDSEHDANVQLAAALKLALAELEPE